MNLDLRKIPAFYINLDKDIEKRKKIEKTLTDLGFSNIIRVPGVVHPTGNKGGCSLAHYNALNKIEPPFIIFEDDIDVKDFKPVVDIPDDCDAFYLGISSWGRMNGHSGPFVQYEKIDENIFRVYNMLGTHSILYLNPEYVSVCQKISYHQYLIEDYIDIGFTDIQKYYNVCCFDNPMFYQTSSNGTNNKLSSYPSEECFTYNKSYWYPSKIF